ncbi:MAG: hypothetical protein AMJ88_13025 [Anaerolineae bacterium SM23_ 63]|nr:MAG: hypothetical protein AMJ88_13025 [Anaerolineae bacterium SM23_ 63]
MPQAFTDAHQTIGGLKCGCDVDEPQELNANGCQQPPPITLAEDVDDRLQLSKVRSDKKDRQDQNEDIQQLTQF